MQLQESMTCPKCSSHHFTAKYESTYIYSYKIEFPQENQDSSIPEELPFLFDNREKKDSVQYIQCNDCKATFPCDFTLGNERVDFTILQKALRGNYTKEIEFWG